MENNNKSDYDQQINSLIEIIRENLRIYEETFKGFKALHDIMGSGGIVTFLTTPQLCDSEEVKQRKMEIDKYFREGLTKLYNQAQNPEDSNK